MSYAVCLFDVDGTLISGGGAGRRAFERACAEVLDITGALVDVRLDGMTDPLILDDACRRAFGRAATAAESEATFARYLVHLDEELLSAEYVVLPGVVELLARLATGGTLLGLATGNLEAGARSKLRRGDLWRHFALGGFGSDAAERAELVKVGLARATARLGRAPAPDEVAVIGDTPRDVASAHANGVVAIGVATGAYSVDDLARAGAHRTFPDLRAWVDELA